MKYFKMCLIFFIILHLDSLFLNSSEIVLAYLVSVINGRSNGDKVK